MKKHLSPVNGGKKPFKCESCDHDSGQKANLQQNVALVHGRKKPSKFAFTYHCQDPLQDFAILILPQALFQTYSKKQLFILYTRAKGKTLQILVHTDL